MGFGIGVRLYLCLLLAFAAIASARNTPFISGNNGEMGAMGSRRSLRANLDDYGEPSANHGHDPPLRGGRGGGGRKG